MLRGGNSEAHNKATQDILEAYRLELNSETSHKSKRGFVRSLLRLAKPYYLTQDDQKEKAVGWALLTTTMALTVFQVVNIGVGFNDLNQDLGNLIQNSYNAAAQGDDAVQKAWDSFGDLMQTLAVLSSKALVVGYANYKAGQHAIRRLRKFITKESESKYLSSQVYYHMQNKSNPLDHPDQRIQEDPGKVADVAFELVNDALDAAVSFATFSAILWGLSENQVILGVEIPKFMFSAVMAYAAVGTGIAYFAAKPLEKRMQEQQQFEGGYRSDLKETHEKREAIALNAGEPIQQKALDESYKKVDENQKKVIGINSYLLAFRVVYNRAASAVPIAVTFPQVVDGAMQLGGIFKVIGAFSEVKNAVSWRVNNEHRIRTLTAYMNRLIDVDDELTQTLKEQAERQELADQYLVQIQHAKPLPPEVGQP